MITPSDVLFAADFRNGIMPTVGGQPSFSRGGDKWVRTRGRGGGPLYQRVRGDQVGFSWVEKGGVLLPRRALDVERSDTSVLSDGTDLQGSAWSSWTVSETVVNSIFAGGAFNGLLVNNDTGSFRQKHQTAGTFTGNPETFLVILEEAGSGSYVNGIGVWNSTASQWAILVNVDFTNESATIANGAGDVFVEKLADSGPNGGKVLAFHLTYDAQTSGDTRSARPVRFNDGNDVIFHHCQLEEQKMASSPIPHTGAPVTRAGEDLVFPLGFDPQDLVVYVRFIDGGTGHASAVPYSRGLWAIGNGAASGESHFQIRGHGLPGDGAYLLQHNDDAGTWHSTGPSTGADLRGELAEMVGVLVGGSRMRFVYRRDGDDAGKLASQDNAPGALGSTWGDARLRLSETFDDGGGQRGRNLFLRFLFAKHAAVDAPTDGGDDIALLNELADVPIGPNRAGHAA